MQSSGKTPMITPLKTPGLEWQVSVTWLCVVCGGASSRADRLTDILMSFLSFYLRHKQHNKATTKLNPANYRQLRIWSNFNKECASENDFQSTTFITSEEQLMLWPFTKILPTYNYVCRGFNYNLVRNRTYTNNNVNPMAISCWAKVTVMSQYRTISL